MNTCVVLGTYNRAHLLYRSLEAYKDKGITVIVIDDDSQDNTKEICDSYDFIRYIKLPPKNGRWRDSASYLNKGISLALFEYNADYVFITHPEIIVGKDTIDDSILLAADSNTWINAKGYYLTSFQQSYIDTVKWQYDLLEVRKLPYFYGSHKSPEFNGNMDYIPEAIERTRVWQSWIFGGGSRSMWLSFGGVSEFEQWGSVDVDLNMRRHKANLNTVTPPKESSIVVHQNHDDLGTPRDIKNAMDVAAQFDYKVVNPKKPELLYYDKYFGIDLLQPKFYGFNSYRSGLFAKLIAEVKPNNIFEVGTWLGGSAFTMVEALVACNLIQSKVYCIDTWLGALEFIDETIGLLSDSNLREQRFLQPKNGYPQIYYQFLSNVIHRGFENRIIPIPNTSSIAARYLKNNKILAELTFIDGSHDEPDVYSDLEHYFDITTKVIFGDDYGWFSVNNAVNKFIKERNLKLEIVDNNFWIIRK